ncbi:MAG: 4-hydroxyphenylacetate 3-hydroxylase [Actinobacteria bacterium]|nr:4-hydroxyphenylacetate 3-hydroxylase [Actinomycetota bacterium]
MIRTGEQYMEGLRAPREIYVGGERITDVLEYAPFRRPIEGYARLYDMKHDPRYAEVLTYREEPDGDLFDMSFRIPKSPEALQAKGRAFRTFAQSSYGCLGRGPEFMAALIAGLSESADWFDQFHQGGSANVAAYCEYVKRNDLFLTHALGNPQTDRSKPAHQQANPYVYLRAKEETKEGLIVRGAKQLATAAPMTDEVLIFPNGRTFGPGDEAYCLCFAIPTTAPGLKIMCREPLVRSDDLNLYDHPLSARFEESDALLVFDDVLVPWDRVFFHNSLEAANNMRFMTGVAAFSGHQSVHRAAVRMALGVATAQALTRSVKTDVFPNVAELTGRLVAQYKAIEAIIFSSEHQSRVTDTGTHWPNGDFQTAHGLLYPDFYLTLLEVLKRTGAAGLMLTPTAGDFVGEAAEFNETYFAGAEMTGSERVQIAKLAWDLTGDAVGQRLALYERFYIGEPMFVASFYSKGADMSEGNQLLHDLLEEGRSDLAARKAQAVAS